MDYAGRLTATSSAPRLILVKADGSVSIHADDRAYKPLRCAALHSEGGHRRG
ncbi:Endonuclease NucS [Streptomyces violarus]